MDAQDVTNLLTLGLGGATVWLGWETRRVAAATKDAVELQSRPYLAIAGVEAVVGTNQGLVTPAPVTGIRFALRLSNPGQVLVTYEVESISVDFEGVTDPSPRFETRGSAIHPKAETKFFCPWIVAPYPPKPGQGGKATVRINYWSTLQHVEHVDFRLRYWLQTQNMSVTEWIFESGPTYA